MPYIPAGRRHGVAFVAMLLAGLVLVVQPAMAATPKHATPTTSSGTGTSQVSSAISAYFSAPGLSTASCVAPDLSQPFSAANDSAYYALAPGQSDSNFTGTNWDLMNGATIKSTDLANGTTGQVLDLPAGALAISPPMCVAYNYPTARMMIRTVGMGAVAAFTVYGTGSGYTVTAGGIAGGSGNSWNLSSPISLQPSSTPGWQIARFALQGLLGESQIYNFYVDPYAKR